MKKEFTRFAYFSDRIYFIYSVAVGFFLLFEIIARAITNRCCGEYFARHGIELLLRWLFFIVISFGPLLLFFYFFFQMVQWIRYRHWKRFLMGAFLFLIINAMWFFDASGPIVALLSLIELFTGHPPRLL